MECLDGHFVCRGACVSPGLCCFDRALRLFALSRELRERTARFFEERERASLGLVDLADEPLFQLQARELTEGLHSLAPQARGLFGSGAQGGVQPTFLVAGAPYRLLDGGERFPAGDHARLTT
ncbi:MAG TPA: hypothetical protein VFB62_06100 [Polyangiaceae bacterium]|nr:hypothetical protein [Polyangiaceae bacterium]